MGNLVRPKKYLGQHFLKDEGIAEKIVESLQSQNLYAKVLEIGPGMGVLTKYLLLKPSFETWVVEIDLESIEYLKNNYPQLVSRIINGDVLKMDLTTLFKEPFAIIGNFPYNISTPILFLVLENKNHIPEVVGMFQKEVAARISSKPGNKSYGILSVLAQAFYNIEYLFTVNEDVFVPPPKVKSAVIRLRRNEIINLPCDEKLFVQVVKTAFNQRRKTLRNALKKFGINKELQQHKFFTQRAEELSVNEFVELTNMVSLV